MSLAPRDIRLPRIGVMTATLGRTEPEAVAAVLIRWHHLNSPDAWVPVTMASFGDLLRDDPVVAPWKQNPIWLRSFLNGLQPVIDGGWVQGWVNGDPTSEGLVTQAFIDAMADSPWDRRGKGATD